MNDIVFYNRDIPVTNSIKVAEVFGKRHNNVLRAIENIVSMDEKVNPITLLKNEQGIPFFEKTTYFEPVSKSQYKMYFISKDGFALLAMGFNGEKAFRFKLQFIKAFNQLSAIAQSYADRINVLTGRLERLEKALVHKAKPLPQRKAVIEEIPVREVNFLREFLNIRVPFGFFSLSLQHRCEYYRNVREGNITMVENGFFIDKVCARQIHIECFQRNFDSFNRKIAAHYFRVMSLIDGWQKSDKTVRTNNYGTQKAFVRS